MTSTLGSWKLLFVAVLLLAFGANQRAAAKTLCVNPGGTKGCFSKINDAIAAAKAKDTIDVAAGTYKEDVVVDKSLSPDRRWIGDDVRGCNRSEHCLLH